MKLSATTTAISMTLIDSYLWSVRKYLRGKLGVDAGDREVYPLVWYINSGRASTDFLGRLVQERPYVIGRLLMKGGSVDEAVERIKARLY